MTEQLIVLCTCPDQEVALDVASRVVDAELAACVNILPGLTSVFRWKGQVETDPEVLLVVKTNDAAYPQLEQAIQAAHPYELPEIIAVSVTRGLPGFLAWIDESVQPKPQGSG